MSENYRTYGGVLGMLNLLNFFGSPGALPFVYMRIVLGMLDLGFRCLITNYGLSIYFFGLCKVEFKQPFCWLYSMPNLLIIQHLETLYLGGNHVRVVCERVWRKAQKCAFCKDSWLDLVSGLRLASHQKRHTCKDVGELKSYTSCCTTGQKSQAG